MRNRIICGNCGGEHIGLEAVISSSALGDTNLMFNVPNRCEVCGCPFSFEPSDRYAILIMPREPR